MVTGHSGRGMLSAGLEGGMRFQGQTLWVIWLLLPILVVPGAAALAEGDSTDDRTVLERIEGTAKKVGKKIEQGVSKTAKKIEDKHLGDKIEQKLKKAVRKTEEGFKKAGDKIDQKLR